jgi:hypothetical protein
MGFDAHGTHHALYGNTHVSRPNAFANFIDGPVVDEEAEWRSVRDNILADWITAHPCSRPAAWWEFDAPGPRPCIYIKDIYTHNNTHAYHLSRQESQAHYLKRNNLLTPEEQQHLAAHPELLATIGPEYQHESDRAWHARSTEFFEPLDPTNEDDRQWISDHPEHIESLEEHYGL